MSNDAIKFINLLFKDTDYIWITNRYKSIKKALSYNEALEMIRNMQPTHDGWLIGLNPAKSLEDKHCLENVSEYRNFLFEMDNFSTEKQLKVIEHLKIPYTSIVHSGNKSLHLVISLDAPVKNLDEYKQVHLGVQRIGHQLFDSQTNRPSVFTRIPGGIRLTNNDQCPQKIVKVGKTIKSDELLRFLRKYQTQRWAYKEALKTFTKAKATKTFKKDNLGVILNNYLDMADKVSGSGSQYSAPCPSCRNNGNDNKGNNLSINTLKEVLHCKRGCDFKDVLDAIKEVINYE